MHFVSIHTIKPLKMVSSPIIRLSEPKIIIKDFAIGIPLNIFSNIFTNLHYGYDITSYESIILQFLLGYYSYGYDRLKDAYQYENSTNITIYSDNKIELYENILKNKDYYNISFNISLFAIIYFMIIKNFDITHIPFIALLYTSVNYKEYKTFLGIYKPFFISVMWTITTIGLPCILNDNTYNIIKYPQDYLPCLLFIFSASNFADINDIDEDKIFGIDTIPVVYGEEIARFISLIALSISAILLIENKNFENRFAINLLLESQQLGLMYYIFNSSKLF